MTRIKCLEHLKKFEDPEAVGGRRGRLRAYRYLTISAQDRDNPHLAREMVKCGKPACRCARDLRHRHGPYLYLRYEEYDRRTGKIHISSGASFLAGPLA